MSDGGTGNIDPQVIQNILSQMGTGQQQDGGQPQKNMVDGVVRQMVESLPSVLKETEMYKEVTKQASGVIDHIKMLTSAAHDLHSRLLVVEEKLGIEKRGDEKGGEEL